MIKLIENISKFGIKALKAYLCFKKLYNMGLIKKKYGYVEVLYAIKEKEGGQDETI